MLEVIKAKDCSSVVVNSILHKLIQHVRADVHIVKAMSEKVGPLLNSWPNNLKYEQP